MPKRKTALILFGILLLAGLAYWPGLTGGFLFDDYPNLAALGGYGKVDDAKTLLLYLTSGTADVTGRPIALLSFLLDAREWPADPWAFKRTNVLLHLVNGVLLFLLLQQLSRAFGGEETEHTADGLPLHTAGALLGAALWLLHPFFLSTTLYVVQREAMLPATFTLLGLHAFLGARRRYDAEGRGLVRAAAWLLVCTALATLSKANGALLPLLALVVDLQLPRLKDERRALLWRRWRLGVLVLPSLLLAVVLVAMTLGSLDTSYPTRAWTLGERLLTQPRVLLDYLWQLWLPRPLSIGLFNDAYNVSRGVFSPPLTLLAILATTLLLASAWYWRRRFPALCLAVLFFFAAHVMESTTLPLELYFEHRNYLPALLLFWPLARVLLQPQGRLVTVRRCLALALPLLLAAQTFLGAQVWGNSGDQMLIWAQRNPTSARAQAYAAQTELERGQDQLALQRLESAWARQPDEAQLALNLIGVRCAAGNLPRSELELAATTLRSTSESSDVIANWLIQALPIARQGACRGFDLDALQQLALALAANPRSTVMPARRQKLEQTLATIALARGEVDTALRHFDAALEPLPQTATLLNQAAQLGSSGHPAQALQQLDRWQPRIARAGGGKGMPALHEELLRRFGYWQSETQRLRALLQADLDAGPTAR